MAHLKSNPITAAFVMLACLSLGTAGFLAGKTAAAKHYAAAGWSQAILRPKTEPLAASPPEPSLNAISPTPPVAAPPRLSVSQILAEAVEHFRAEDTDPDARSKGLATLEKLRTEDGPEALRSLQLYQSERRVYEGMAPSILALWAQTNPRPAVDYALANLKGRALITSLEQVSRAWARRDPNEAWAWYRQTRDFAQPPTMGGVAASIFTEWAGRDPAEAFAQVSRLDPADEKVALSGIADAARAPGQRPAILVGIAQMTDEEQRRRRASAVAHRWAETEPQAAAEWVASLSFHNPAAGFLIFGEIFEEWWRLDPHATAKWVLTEGPLALRDQFRKLSPPEELRKLQEAGR